MDCVEDSGFDSDQQKPGKTKEMANSCRLHSTTEEVVVAQVLLLFVLLLPRSIQDPQGLEY